MSYIVVSSPSGGGKTTICNMLLQDTRSPIFQNVSFSISATTRPKREHETDGFEYFFLSSDEFNDMIGRGEFLEYATVCGNLYGTPLRGIAKNKHTLFDVDYQGFEQINRNVAEKPINIFLLPPSMMDLQQRLENRGDIKSNIIRARMQNALEEISHSQKYDYILTNYDVEYTFQMVVNIVYNNINCDTTQKMSDMTSTIKMLDCNNVDEYLKSALKITQNASHSSC